MTPFSSWSLALLLLLAGALGACGGTASIPARNLTAYDAAQRDVGRAAAQAKTAAANQPDYVFLVRRNPAACLCPDWEILAAGRWQRVSIVLGDRSAPSAAPSLASMPDGLAIQARLQPTSSTATSGSGWHYPVLEVVGPIGDVRVTDD